MYFLSNKVIKWDIIYNMLKVISLNGNSLLLDVRFNKMYSIYAF